MCSFYFFINSTPLHLGSHTKENSQVRVGLAHKGFRTIELYWYSVYRQPGGGLESVVQPLGADPKNLSSKEKVKKKTLSLRTSYPRSTTVAVGVRKQC